MPKMKGQTTGSNHSVNVLRWTDEMDQVLMNAFTEELRKGNRHDGSLTSEAYSNVIKVFQHVVAPNMTKQHIKNRMKTLKEHFAESYDLFNNPSGFAWNPMTKRFEAQDDVWEYFIKDKPQAVKWRTMQIRHYDTLNELFGADRATGKRASTARQRAPQMQHDNINLNDAQDDISMPKQVVDELGEGHFSPPNLESFSPAFAQSHQTIETSGSRGTKRKAQMFELVEGQLEKMSSGLGLVADALNKGNCISDKLHDVADRQVTIADRHAVIAECQVTVIEKRNEFFQNQLNIIQHTRLRVYSEAEV
ncbi:putative Myb/SANT-like domain-containing protein [Lupinus albus]|uniref:Putative Myb/SANT-like domain-containing protein n=1 Tax=Lupinus albus TaxID=3870 RepID=A0A6A4NV38_LUPAL|nr:putative Myb/SANT-like domain-containing protein [Lupinus albus]